MSDISRADRERLEGFVLKVNETCDLRLIRNNGLKHISFKMTLTSNKLSDESGSSIELTSIDEDDFRSFLMAFRQFWLQKDSLNVDKILLLGRKYLKTEHYAIHANLGRMWKAAHHSQMSFFDGKVEVTRELVLDHWLNGHYFHNDISLSLSIKQWKESDWLFWYRAELLFAVQELFQCIRFISKFVSDGITNNWFDFDSPSF